MSGFKFFENFKRDKTGIELGIVHEASSPDESRTEASAIQMTEDEVLGAFGISKEELRKLAIAMLTFTNSEIAKHTSPRHILLKLQEMYPSYDVVAVMKMHGYTPLEEASYEGINNRTVH